MNPVQEFIQKQSKKQLQELLEQSLWHDGFGCYTKQGFKLLVWPTIAPKARWLIFFDVDGVHEINETNKSYAAFDAMMNKVFAQLRSTDIVAGQVNSGDEFLVCLTEVEGRIPDPEGLMSRIWDLLAEQGLTASYAIIPVQGNNLDLLLAPAIKAVFESKIARGIKR